jgi:hypothetical protein
MTSPVGVDALFERLLQADELGIRLEIVGGLPLWEAGPTRRHQRAIDRIRASLRAAPHAGSGRGCEPDEDDEAITLVPEAVIEIVSRGYEAKDLEIGPRFYLSQGVKDVVVFDPHTLLVLHLAPDRAERLVSPVDITLACGCACRV